MDSLIQTFQEFNTYAKSNPIIAGAVSLWGLGILTWVCRGVPVAVYGFLRRQLTTTLSFTNVGIGTNLETFANFMRWFEKNKWIRYSRSMSLNGVYYGESEDGTVVGMGPGNHFFLYRGRPMWLNRTMLANNNTFSNITYELTITTLGRSRQILLDLVEEFKYRPPRSKIGIYTLDNGWVRMADIPKRPLNTVIVDPEIKKEIVGLITDFRASRQWFEDRGLPYKKTFVLHGIHGTGKTSLIKALASHFQMNICIINLGMMSDSSFEKALTTAPTNAIIIIEDFDSSPATRARRALVEKERRDKRSKSDQSANLYHTAGADDTLAEAPSEAETSMERLMDSMPTFLTLSGILNALDGIVSLDGKLIFMTTNLYDTMDPALTRKGRIDHCYELKALQSPEVWEYITLMFPNTVRNEDLSFHPILGCDLQDLYFQHKNDAQSFIEAIPHQTADRLRLIQGG